MQFLSIKIFRLAQILAGSCQKAWERAENEELRLLFSSIVIWPRITSGFTSNCSAVHLLKRQPRVASCNRAKAR
jgi:hypothetical protein